MTERFQNELLSICTANPGWNVRIRVTDYDPATKEPTLVDEQVCPIVAWGVVQVHYADGTVQTQTEPVFVTKTGPFHATEYRRNYAEIDDSDDPIKTMVDIAIIQPAGVVPVGALA